MFADLVILVKYLLVFIVLVAIVNYLIDRYFAKSKMAKDKDVSTEKEEEIISPPEPRFGIYNPSVFSKKLSQNLYRRVVIYNCYFYDVKWMDTFCEILFLLNLSDKDSVAIQNSNPIHIVNGTRGMKGAQTAELYQAYQLHDLSLQSLDYFIKHYSANDLENFSEIILAILVLHINEIGAIQYWAFEQNDKKLKRAELIRYLTRRLSFEQQNYILKLIESIDPDKELIDEANIIVLCYSVVKIGLKTVTKLVVEDLIHDTWPQSLPSIRLQKKYLTIDEIFEL